MSDWLKNDNPENNQGSIATAVAAAAAEITALSEYAYIPELDLHFDQNSGYFFKEGRHDFHHAPSHYTYHFDDILSTWQCSFDPDWDKTVGCPASVDAFVLLSDLLDKLEIDHVPHDAASSPASSTQREETASPTDEILPCIRAIVLESDNLPYGHLSIITVDGAAIARCEAPEDDEGGLAIVDLLADKALCRVRFDAKSRRFQLDKVMMEGGDEEGELVENSNVLVTVNDVPVHKEAMDIAHLDRLSVDCGNAGFMSLSLHIHKATNTCAGCEPGLLLSDWHGNALNSNPMAESSSRRESLERKRRRELKQLKKKFGLSRADYVQTEKPRNKDGSYTDRADIRRRTVGSDLPQSALEAMDVKTVASASKPVDEGNRGYQMLKKMGWKKGSGVGKQEHGIKEPICPVGHLDSSGLGANTSLRVAVGDGSAAQKRFKWSRAAQRYAKIEKTTVSDVFVDDIEDCL